MAKIPHKRRSLFFIPVLMAVSAVVGGLYGPTAQVASAATGDDEIGASVKEFTRLYSTVEQNFADPVNADKSIYNGAIPGMLRTLDPHSNFFDPKALAQMREDQRGHYYGVGMRIEGRANQSGVMQTIIVEPFVGSPAYKAGLRPNDVLSSVNGKATDGLNSTQVADMLKGQKGTPVEIKVLRGEGAEVLTVSIIRDEINRSSIPAAFMIRPGVAYIKMEEFIETTGADFEAALKRLDEDNLKGLILDLRANPGGLLTQAVRVSDHLLPKGVEIVSHRGRASREKSYSASEGNHGRNYPVVILVNRNSASASEIVSGALQDHDRAWILGDNTFGKGLVQTVYPLVEQTGLALTTAHYYTPSGRLIQRDYSSVSFFDYYYRTNTEARNLSDVKMTDSGRTVYGGGGISPDQKFEAAKAGPLETDLFVKYMFRNYTKHFFSVHKEQLPKGWTLGASEMKELHDWLLSQKYELNEANYTKEYEAIRRRMQSEFYKTAFSVDDSTRYIIETDPEVAAAVDALPKAQALLSTAAKVRAERAKK